MVHYPYCSTGLGVGGSDSADGLVEQGMCVLA